MYEAYQLNFQLDDRFLVTLLLRDKIRRMRHLAAWPVVAGREEGPAW